MKIIKSVVACILAIIVIMVLSIIMDQLIFRQVSSIKLISRGGGILTFAMGVLLCVLYPMLAFPIGGLFGFILLSISRYFQSRKTVFYTTAIYFGLLALYFIIRLWYLTIPTIWDNFHLFWTGSAIACLGDLSIAILIVFFTYFYIDSEHGNKP